MKYLLRCILHMLYAVTPNKDSPVNKIADGNLLRNVAKSIRNNKCSISLQYLKQEVINEVVFFHGDKL